MYQQKPGPMMDPKHKPFKVYTRIHPIFGEIHLFKVFKQVTRRYARRHKLLS